MSALYDYRFNLITIPLFFVFSTFVVYISQRLVEQAAIALEPLERKIAFLRTALCIGCLVWSLDVSGHLMYPEMIFREPRLAPVLLALLVMVSGSILSVPALTNTRQTKNIVFAALTLVLFMFGAHILLASSFGSLTGEISWRAVLVSIILAVGLAMALALRHRSARLSAFNGGFRPLSFKENLLAGMTIIPLHFFLVASVPLAPDDSANGRGEAFLVSIVFGVLVAVLQLYLMRVETARGKLMNRAHARLRTLPDDPGFIEGQQLSLIAERLPVLLSNENLQLHFQPIVPTAKNAKIRFEALLRMEDRQLGRINPEMFMLACARVELQGMVDRMIIRRALELSELWSLQASNCAGISVNVSPETINSTEFVYWMRDELSRYSIPDGWLKLEITEHSMVATDDGIVSIILQLRALGVGVILDDFGTGFSSLGVIISLPIEGMKIDRSLTFNLDRCHSSQILVKHLTALAKDLGLKVTVEGAENVEQLSIICRNPVDAVQGYVFAKALPPDLVVDWLHDYNKQSAQKAFLLPLPGWMKGNKKRNRVSGMVSDVLPVSENGPAPYTKSSKNAPFIPKRRGNYRFVRFSVGSFKLSRLSCFRICRRPRG